jgi:hypothetical protein
MNIKKLCRPWRFNKNLVEICDDYILGDISKQNYSVIGISKHIGVKLRCKKCDCVFAFTAKEQVHWYENIKFWSDSVPVECKDCRGVTRSIIDLNKRLSKVLAVKNMDIDDYNEISDVAMGMLGNGIKFGGRIAQKIRMAAKRSDHAAKDYLLNNVVAI